MVDRSSRPKTCPHKTSHKLARQIVRFRWRLRLGPVQILAGSRFRLRPSTRCWCAAASTGCPTDGCGWHYVGKQQGDRNKESTAKRTGMRGHAYRPLIGTAFVQTVNRRPLPCRLYRDLRQRGGRHRHPSLQRAVSWFADHGITTQAGTLRPRLCLSVLRLAQRLQRTRHRPQAAPALPATDQWQDRTLPLHPGRRVGLRPPLRVNRPPKRRVARLAPLLQSSSRPLHDRRPPTNHPADQPFLNITPRAQPPLTRRLLVHSRSDFGSRLVGLC